MTSHPKEALDRLTRIAALVEHRGVADAVVKVKDLRALIAKQEGLEREVERLKDNYGVVEIEVERLRRIETALLERGFVTGADACAMIDRVLNRAEDAESKFAELKALYDHSCAAKAEMRDDLEAAEAKLSALEEAARNALHHHEMGWSRKPTMNALRALLDRAAPMASDEQSNNGSALNKNGPGNCQPRQGAAPMTERSGSAEDIGRVYSLSPAVPVKDVAGLLKRAREYVTDALEAHEHSDGRELLQDIDAALLPVPPSQGAETVDSELAAADNNHKALVEAAKSLSEALCFDHEARVMFKPVYPNGEIAGRWGALEDALTPRQADKTLCASDDPAERCLSCDCWKLTREMCT